MERFLLRAGLAAIALAASVPAWPLPRKPVREEVRAAVQAQASRNLRISFRVRLGTLEESGNFVVADGEQGNYVVGADTAAARGSAGAAKTGVIINVVPTVSPDDPGSVDLQLQAELSGPSGGREAAARTFQLQTRLQTRIGRPFNVVDDSDRRLELRVDRAEP